VERGEISIGEVRRTTRLVKKVERRGQGSREDGQENRLVAEEVERRRRRRRRRRE
jgi:hypothetical protein